MDIIDSGDYKIYLDTSLQSLQSFVMQNEYSKLFVLVDENTQRYCLPLFKEKLPELNITACIVVPIGEINKTMDSALDICRQLIEGGADRNALLLNLGGGVVTDMGGFVASIFKRGINFVQVPTSLLAQVDASVGGKTAIDFMHIKNVLGTFTFPKAVFIDKDFLSTLPHLQLLSGFAEIIKHSIIADASYFKELECLEEPSQISMRHIQQSIAIKNTIVLQDPLEEGLRKVLNYGHTIGHALESWSLTNDAAPLTHGAAIAIGMIAEAYLAHKNGMLSMLELASISSLIQGHFGHYVLRKDIDEALLALMQHDKKHTVMGMNFSLPSGIGACTYDIKVDEKAILESMDYYRSLAQ